MEVVDIDNIPVHYTVQGSGAPLILLHGWGCNHSTVAYIASVAAESHTVYNVDLPGFGETPEPPGVWGVEDYTRLIEHFADALHIDAPVLVGHSFGGRISILYSSRRPASKVVLVDAAGVKPRHSLRYYYKVYSYKFIKNVVRLLLPSPMADRIIEKRRARSGSSDYNNSSNLMRAVLSRCVNEDLRSVMPSINAPVLLIWGENDTATPLSDARIMERLIPDAGLVSFPGCGHYSFLDSPVQFAAVLRSFLKS